VTQAVPATLDVRDLRLRIGLSPILRGVSLRIAPGEVHGLIGESGAGKSMVGRAILGVLPPGTTIDGGTIRFQNDDLLGLSDRARRRLLGRAIALVPQDPMAALNPVRRIVAQMTDGLRFRMDMTPRVARRHAAELLAQVRIRDPERVLRQYPHELSGGMRQRVLIAMAFSCQPSLVIADEPTTALDVTVQRQILRLMRRLQHEYRIAMLFITHDLGVVAKMCGRVSVMHSGRVVESGLASEIFAAPKHDYTRALFAATPRYDRPTDALVPVPDALTDRLLAEARAYDAGEVIA
jgi:peptide/nickel transport system ATP-binding protein